MPVLGGKEVPFFFNPHHLTAVPFPTVSSVTIALRPVSSCGDSTFPGEKDRSGAILLESKQAFWCRLVFLPGISP